MNPTIPHARGLLVAMAPVRALSSGSSPAVQSAWRHAAAVPAYEGQPANVADNEAFPAVNPPAWGDMNERRAELIRKDLREGLTADELREYERLQRLSLAAVVQAFPRPKPDFEELARLRKELRARSSR